MTDTFLRTADGLELAGLALVPATAPRASVAMVHGFGEHAGRYAALHRVLLDGGYAIGAADLRGHGRSPGPRGHIDGWDDYRVDCAAIVAHARTLAPGRPVFLFGHSMGGLIVLDFAIERRDPAIDGVVASGAALLQAGPRRRLRELGARMLSRVAPRLSTELGLDPQGISSEAEEVAAYLADPLVHGRASMRWGAEILRTMATTRARAKAVSVPLLLLHGAADPINSPDGSRAFHDACGHPDRGLKIYPGCRHEIHHDVGRRRLERDLLRWLGERAMRARADEGRMST